MDKNVEKLFITTCDKIVLALLDGPLQNKDISKAVGVTPQHLSVLLPRLQDYQIIVSRMDKGKRINRLTSKGLAIAETVLTCQKTLEARLPEQEIREQQLKGWI